jgi:dolichyl-diphosphooligosaccharide--protein glycosyltransferase
MSEDMDRTWTVSLLFLLFAVSVVVRSLPFGHVFDSGGVFFFEGDCYLHLRKILLHIRNFPHFVTFDFFEGYPQGTPAIGPPLLDWTMSALSMLIGMGNPSVRVVEVIAAILPPLFGGLTVITVYYFAKEVFNKEIAFISSAILAFMPAHIEFTIISRPDNEMIEPLMVTLLCLSYIKMQRGRKSLHGMLLFSIVAFFSLLFWRGATVWVLLAAIIGFLDVTLDFLRQDTSGKKHLRTGGAFMLLSACLLPVVYFNVWGTQDTFSFSIISWFHTAVFGAVAVGIFVYGYACLVWLRRGYQRGVLLILVAGAIIVVPSVLILMVPALRENVAAGLGILGIGSQDPWIITIEEYQPLLKNGFWRVLPDYYGWLFWLLPAILVFLGIELFRDGFKDRGKVVFVVMSIYVLVLALLRRRFMHILAIDVAIVGGWLIFTSYRLAGKGGRRFNAFMVSAILSVLLFYPFASAAYKMPSMSIGASVKGDLLDTMSWIRDNTPAPSDIYDPLKKPPYSVMAKWDQAGWVLYLAQRPVVATLWGTEAYGYKESKMFYAAENEFEANAIMEQTGAKYLILNEKLFSDAVSSRLYYADGMDVTSAIISFSGVDHYRLVYESSKSNESTQLIQRDVKEFKVFEYVKGVSLKVKASPGNKVTVVSRVKSNQGRIFLFFKKGWADSEGSVNFTLPYAPLGGAGRTGLIVPYKVKAGEGSAEVSVNEADVLEGRSIELQIPKKL